VCEAVVGSVIGAGVVLGDKSSVRNCVVGDQCVLSAKVKLANCVVMDHVSIEQGQVTSSPCFYTYLNLSFDAVVRAVGRASGL